MQMSELKKGFFGYQRESVYQYIAALNESFSQKLLETEQRADAAMADLKKENAALEQELSALKKESDEYKRIHFSISDSIIHAQNYAEQLKMETQKKEESMRSRIEEQMAQRQRQLEEYSAQVEEFREHLKSLLQEIDVGLEVALDKAAGMRRNSSGSRGEEPEEEADGAAKKPNMSLFEIENKR